VITRRFSAAWAAALCAVSVAVLSGTTPAGAGLPLPRLHPSGRPAGTSEIAGASSAGRTAHAVAGLSGGWEEAGTVSTLIETSTFTATSATYRDGTLTVTGVDGPVTDTVTLTPTGTPTTGVDYQMPGGSVLASSYCGSQGTYFGEAELTQWIPTGPAVTSAAVVYAFVCNDGDIVEGQIAVDMVNNQVGQGYYEYDQFGDLGGFGNNSYLTYLGNLGMYNLNAPVIGMSVTPDGGGYWMLGSDGGIFSFGDAHFYGSTGGLVLNKPVVAMAATPDGKGYWLVASDGGIFAYGDARFHGSMGGQTLNQPIVGMAATPDGQGYWLVASDGGIFAFGDAKFHGSAGSLHLNAPIVGMAATPDGKGYWFVASDGGIFAYGDAKFYGSTGSLRLNAPIVGMAATPDGKGYWFVASDGGVFAYGDAKFSGSLGGTGSAGIAGIAVS
jgi:ribosomal protein L24E